VTVLSRLGGAAAAILTTATAVAQPAAVPALELVVEIGCESCDGPLQLGSVLDVDVDQTGRILVTTGEAPMLRLFDHRGKLIWIAGDEGTGPGEFRRPMRALLGSSVIQVVDMTLRRVTRLDPDGRFRSSVPLRGFPTAVAPAVRSESFVILVDDFRGGLRLDRWTATDSGTTQALIAPPGERRPGTIVFSALAVAPDGRLAYAPDVDNYRIDLLSPDGAPLGAITREVARVKRTPEERAALDRLTARVSARVRGERRNEPTRAPRPSGDPDWKPHLAIDGLRFDDAGRLWVRSMRGDQVSSVFDLFTAAGSFAGEVRLDGAVDRFAHAGHWIVVGGTTTADYPVVRLYRVRS